MTWRTHAVVGANSLWLLFLSGKIDAPAILIYLPVALFASILPDIDANAAKIHYVAGGAFGIFKGLFSGRYFHHRGIMHSIFIAVLFSFIIWIFFRQSFPALPYIFGASYLSHALIDGFNTKVGFFYPFTTKRFALLPRPLLSPVKGAADKLLFVGAALSLLLFFYFFKSVIP